MANKINVKLILELRDANMSRNGIASAKHFSKNSVSDVFHIADSMGITFAAVRDLDEGTVYRMFYPGKHAAERIFKEPDYDYVHGELRRNGVTLKLLWEEYCGGLRDEGAVPVGYAKFCRGYEGYTIANSVTSHIEHRPGVAVEVDWSGSTMAYCDEAACEFVKVYLFVATLPYSQYSYVEPCLDMKQNTWLACHINMYEFFGGSPLRTVCDNLKTGVAKHPREGEIVLNASYEALASHYMTAVMPTGVRKPRQKASVEGTVGKVATAIVAKLRDVKFASFYELKKAVREKLDEFNKTPFQKRDRSRHEVFMEEKRSLRPLPTVRYEIAEWVYGRTVNFDCHVVYAKNRYSCPYQHVGKKADLKVTASAVEIYVGGERVATHTKYPDYVEYRYSTHAEDMPDRFQKMEWDDGRIQRWADSIGPCTGEVVRRIIGKSAIKEQGYNPSLSVLRLGKKFSEERLETACELALTKAASPRYHHINAILAADQDKIFLAGRASAEEDEDAHGAMGYVRGPEYYGGGKND